MLLRYSYIQDILFNNRLDIREKREEKESERERERERERAASAFLFSY